MMLDFTIALAREVGTMLRDYATRPRQIDRKRAFELVTDADRASEAYIVNAIREQFPDHAILAEEGGGIERDSPWQWLVDPLDGTNNFAHGFRYYSVSLALLYEGAPFIGVVFDPNYDEVFAAERGKGATCNGAPIQVSGALKLGDALLSTGFPYDFATNSRNNLVEFGRVHRYVQGIRRAGSAALDLANVACGRLEAHWEFGLQPWDSAAGAVLVQEAGGSISGHDGSNWTPWSSSMVATNGRIHSELLEVLTSQE